MSYAPLSPSSGALRLVRPGETPAEPISRAPLSPTRVRIRRENQSAALLTEHDARRIMALRVAEQIEGGRAALITPEKRARLMTISRALGLRPFDASLIIAIVQDAARTGRSETPSASDHAHHADSPRVQSRLSMIPAPPKNSLHRAARSAKARTRTIIITSAAAIALAALLLTALIRWLTRV